MAKHCLVTCSCGWERECSSEWAASSAAKLHHQLGPLDVNQAPPPVLSRHRQSLDAMPAPFHHAPHPEGLPYQRRRSGGASRRESPSHTPDMAALRAGGHARQATWAGSRRLNEMRFCLSSPDSSGSAYRPASDPRWPRKVGSARYHRPGQSACRIRRRSATPHLIAGVHVNDSLISRHLCSLPLAPPDGLRLNRQESTVNNCPRRASACLGG
jgi:hypothetical protein